MEESVGTRIPALNLEDFMFTEREEPKGRYLEFLHIPSGFGLSLPVPHFLVKGSPAYLEWRTKKLTDLVIPVVKEVVTYARLEEKAG